MSTMKKIWNVSKNTSALNQRRNFFSQMEKKSFFKIYFFSEIRSTLWKLSPTTAPPVWEKYLSVLFSLNGHMNAKKQLRQNSSFFELVSKPGPIRRAIYSIENRCKVLSAYWIKPLRERWWTGCYTLLNISRDCTGIQTQAVLIQICLLGHYLLQGSTRS